jgi:transcription antitermination factor NusG
MLMEDRQLESDLSWPTCESGSWYVLRTRARQEKILAKSIMSRGAFSFLPLVVRAEYYGGRKVRVERPLFEGYVFLHGSLDDAYEADRTKRVAQIINVPDQRRLDEELQNIELALSSSAAEFTPYPYLRAGVRVEVKDGPFRGLQGLIESRSRRDRLILQVDMLGRAISVEIDGSLLDVID